ncbi:MAG TPA: hypothetical protein VE082_07615 [Desulfobaccales bacterium]|jgi:hypothetical protein|nr:hypothetical protein [Desulfobaccales bacterium]
MVMGIFFAGAFLVLSAMFHMAFQAWRSRRPARQKILVSRRTLNRKDQSGV